MGTAYTPGLKVSPATTVRKTRRLPLKGEVTVTVGERVGPDTVVARAAIPGILRTVRAAERLGIDPDEVPKAAVVTQGQEVATGEPLARHRSFFGLFVHEAKSPVDGTVELINPVTGHISVRERPNPIEVTAYVEGRVVEVMPGEGVVVETLGAHIQGIFGVGGERRGPIRMAVAAPDEPLSPDRIGADMQGAVLVGGANLPAESLRKAADLGVAGLVVGAIVDRDLIDFLGYDIGVAITGHETIPLTLILTEGFGTIPMAERTFRLLSSLQGQTASINGATQIRAGVIRPEVIVPHGGEGQDEAENENELSIGTPIRIIREPYFGLLATVTELPPELVEIPSGAQVRVLKARLAAGDEVVVPRANVEIIAG